MGIATMIKSPELLSSELHVLTQEELRDLQLLLIDMTRDIATICLENNISWSLGGGSLLGVVRHGGFIPWDDDIDLTMLRSDFDRFKTVFPGRFSDKYELKIPGDKDFLYHFPRVYRKNTIAQSIQSSEDFLEGVAVDIFIMENASDNPLIRSMHGILCTALLLADSVMRMKRCESNLLNYGANSPALCSAVQKRARLAAFFRFLRLEQWLKLSDTVFALCRNTKSQYVVIPSGNGHFFGELFLREKMTACIPSSFECIQCRIPEDSDYYLRIRYGNRYMTPPPLALQEKHTYIYFKINISEEKQWLGPKI